jgi:hypothetical protein
LIVNRQIHGGVNVSFLFVAAHMQVPMIFAPVSETVNQPGIAMEVKDDRLIGGEERVKVRIC